MSDENAVWAALPKGFVLNNRWKASFAPLPWAWVRDSQLTSSSPRLLPQIGRVIGKGTFARIFRASDIHTNDKVAIKVEDTTQVRPTASQPRFRAPLF